MKRIFRCLIWFMIFALPATSFAYADGSPAKNVSGYRKEITRGNPAGSSQVICTWNESGILIEWSTAGDLAKVELFRNGELVNELSGWIENSGELLYTADIPDSRGYGEGFSVKITNERETSIWSDEFEVYAVNVIQPSSDEILHAGEVADITLEWGEWPAPLYADVYKGDRFIERIAEFLPSGTLSYQWQDTVSCDWLTGDDYRIRLSDAEGFYGWSEPFSIIRSWYALSSIADDIEPGDVFQGSFTFPENAFIGHFLGREFQMYYFLQETNTPLHVDILDSSGKVLLSPEYRTDDQNGGEGIYWDCLQEGDYFIRITPAHPDMKEYRIHMFEIPGWEAAEPFVSDRTIEGSIDYPGDVDYFTIRVTGNILWKNKYNVELSDLEHAILMRIDIDNSCSEEVSEGINEASIKGNLGILSGSRDIYFGVSGSEGFYSINGTQKIDAGMTALNIFVEELILIGVGLLLSTLIE